MEPSPPELTPPTTAQPLPSAIHNSSMLISDEISTLHSLALRGSWRTILEKVSQARSFSLLRYPHEHLVYLSFNALSLLKLRRYSDAMDDINASLDNNLDSPSYRYEAFPHIYPNRKGSMIPFSLRWIHAILPTFLKSPDSLDRLYILLDFVRSRIDEEKDNPNFRVSDGSEENPNFRVGGRREEESEDNPNFRVTREEETQDNPNFRVTEESEQNHSFRVSRRNGEETEENNPYFRVSEESEENPNSRVWEGSPNLRVWRRREALVIGTIISIHSSQKEFNVCLSLIRYLISKDKENPNLLSKLGYVQLQFGDLDGARVTFNLVERLILGKKDCSVEDLNLVGRNKALVYMVGKDYVSAVREYDQCIERDAGDAVAINNKGLCLMYLRDLTDSIKVLENALERVPTAALNETVIVNLCSMYELAFVNHFDLKKTLSNWIARIAPDDFDSSCTRI